MKLAESGSRGVFWRTSPRGTQERKRPSGAREREIGGFGGRARMGIFIGLR